MSSKTKIVVLHMKEVIYTAIFLIMAVLLIAVLIIMFGPKKSPIATSAVIEETISEKYIAGVYTTSIELNDNSFDVQVTVDKDHINSIKLVNLSETTTAMYPLMEPTLDTLASQIYDAQSTDNIATQDDNKYTSMLLLEAIKTALSKAVPQ